ncbi:MAG: hypothetical protein AAGD34_21955, partial [Pseudomonadota bacterium]
MTDTNATPLWRPDDAAIERAAITRLCTLAKTRAGRSIDGFDALHAWSVEDPGAFWDLVWD